MKKFNKNIIVFVMAFLFLGLGFSRQYFLSLRYCGIDFLLHNMRADGFDAFQQLASDVDSCSKKLRYQSVLLDLDSLRQFCLNTRLVQKGHEIVVKGEGDTLFVPYEHYPEDALRENTSAIQSIQVAAEANGADFLYIAVPEKNMIYTAPSNIENHSIDNYERYLAALEQDGIPVLDLYSVMLQKNKIHMDTFFRTDHHWTPETAFWAMGEICSSLNDRYGFSYNPEYTQIANYHTKVYPDWFLGSYGKKVGYFFSAAGPDDITLITPKFETDLTEQRPLVHKERTGTFDQTVLYMDEIEVRDYHNLSAYAAYSGGDFRLQIVKNNLNPDGKKILMIRDSFAGAVTPFLALNAGELHTIDVRSFHSDEPINVYEYIQQTDPDYVLVLYSGTGNPLNDYGRYEFGQP